MNATAIFLVLVPLLSNGCTPEISVGIRTLRGDDPLQTERTDPSNAAQARKYGRSMASDAAGPPDLRGVGLLSSLGALPVHCCRTQRCLLAPMANSTTTRRTPIPPMMQITVAMRLSGEQFVKVWHFTHPLRHFTHFHIRRPYQEVAKPRNSGALPYGTKLDCLLM